MPDNQVLLLELAEEAVDQRDLGAEPKLPLIARLLRSRNRREQLVDERPLTRLANGIVATGIESQAKSIELIAGTDTLTVRFVDRAAGGKPIQFPGSAYDRLLTRYRQMAKVAPAFIEGSFPIRFGAADL